MIRQRCSGSSTDIAGPDAIFRVDSFEGQQLPPKSQIKSIHVHARSVRGQKRSSRDRHSLTSITQPGVGAIRGGANLSFRDSSMSAQEPVHADQSR